MSARELTPGPGRRQTPVRGVLLTDAELDHTLGLFSLREASELDVYATASVLGAMQRHLPTKAMTGAQWHTLQPARPVTLAGLTVTPFLAGEKRPRYADECRGDDWVIGLRLQDTDGQIIVYAPCFGTWTKQLDNAVKGASVAIIDGTFFTPDEMPGVNGHLSIQDSLPNLARHKRTRFIYTHLNNTNPLLSHDRGLPIAVEMGLL